MTTTNPDLVERIKALEAERAILIATKREQLSRQAARIEELEQASEWQMIETAPEACHVLATRWSEDDAEWIIDVMFSPPSKPWTHWQHLPKPPALGAS